MNLAKKTLWIASAAAAVALGIGYAVSTTHSSTGESLQVFATGRTHSQREARPSLETAHALTRSSPLDAAQIGNESGKVLSAFNTSKDYRAFAAQARTRPDLGGVFYADIAVNRCKGEAMTRKLTGRAQLDLSDAQDTGTQLARTQAFELIQRRCMYFTDAELAVDLDKPALTPADTSADVIYRASRELSRARASGRGEALRSAYGAILELADPLLFDQLGLGLITGSTSDGRTAFWFDGIAYPVMEDPPIAAALRLLPCSLGLECGPTDYSLASSCANGNVCFASREEEVRRTLARGDEARFQEILRWRDTLYDAVRQKRVEAFSRRG